MPNYIEFNILPKVPSQAGYKVLDGIQYDIWIRYNITTGKWMIDLTSMDDSSVSVEGQALLQGRDILGSHGYQNILGELWVEDTSGTYDDPTYEGMGDRWRLRYYPLTT